MSSDLDVITHICLTWMNLTCTIEKDNNFNGLRSILH